MNSRNWTVRRATAADVNSLVEFNCAIAFETEDRTLDRRVVQRGVERGLEQGDEVIYFVAVDANGPIGSLMLTREWSDWRDGWLAWIQSVYVVAEHRGSGVFRSMLEHATQAVSQNPDVVGMRLYVETENERAQAVYLKTGFADPHYKVLEKMLSRRD